MLVFIAAQSSLKVITGVAVEPMSNVEMGDCSHEYNTCVNNLDSMRHRLFARIVTKTDSTTEVQYGQLIEYSEDGRFKTVSIATNDTVTLHIKDIPSNKKTKG